MVISCGAITSAGNEPVVASYGAQPNSEGPSGNGYSVLLANQTVEPHWTMGQDMENALTLDTVATDDSGVKSSLTWKIINDSRHPRLGVFAKQEGEHIFSVVESPNLVKAGSSFRIWVGNSTVAVANDEHALTGRTDHNPYRFFVMNARTRESTASNDPAVLLKCLAS